MSGRRSVLSLWVALMWAAVGCTCDTVYVSFVPDAGGSDAGRDASFDANLADGGADTGSADSGGGTDSGGTDSGGTDASGTDAGAGSDAGWPGLGPFGSPVLMSISDPTALDDDPSLTVDLLELFFNSNRIGSLAGSTDIWVSTRASALDAWGTPVLVPVVNTIDSETTPQISADGLTLWFASNRPGGLGLQDIYVSTRASRAGAWSAPVPVAELSTVDTELAPGIDFTGLRMILSRQPNAGVTSWDLFETSRPDLTSTWAMPTPIVELNTALGVEANGHLSPSGLILIFDMDLGGTTDRNFYYVTRPNLTAPFGMPVEITELNGPTLDEDSWTSPDLRYIVFHSDRSGNSEIYEASR